eukprot:Gb_02347 [translate_table: standard]
METMSRSLENVLCMKGGSGDSSYAHNSSVQMRMVEAVKPFLQSGIAEDMRVEWLRCLEGGVFRIADLGCATGVNTLLAADTIVNSLNQICIRHSIGCVPEFQVYFADLPSNDFNSLFRLLPPHQLPGSGECGRPKVSSVERRRIFISSEEVGAAYLRQFTTDFTAFLRARAEEMVPQGCIFIALVGRNSYDVKQQGGLGTLAHHLEAAFDNLVSEEKRESFNVPFFGPNMEELEKIVEMENSFEIESIRLLRGLPSYPMREVREGKEEMFGRVVGNQHIALFENLVRAHLGSDDLINHFFSRIAHRAASNWQ